ncbi:hypothetical protein [Streptomyces sp. SID8374]|uniref:hypothetical protein n=1 Tax=Streptomyces sp. SID8374 TaxID=2690354 RepID=UPI0019276CAD|nr:hypothetical protein [Streptomyces sp. SID8374]
MRDEGRAALADRLVLVAGPLRGPDGHAEDAAALDTLRAPAPNAPAARVHRPALPELPDRARTGTPEEIRRALGRLVEEHTPTPGSEPDPALRAVIAELLRHPRAGVRLHAHRVSRALFDRDAHARSTAVLLSEPLPEVVRMAVRTLGRLAWKPALPELISLLGHPELPSAAPRAKRSPDSARRRSPRCAGRRRTPGPTGDRATRIFSPGWRNPTRARS